MARLTSKAKNKIKPATAAATAAAPARSPKATSSATTPPTVAATSTGQRAARTALPVPTRSVVPILTAEDRAEIEAILLEDRARVLRSAKTQHDTLVNELAGTDRSGDVVDRSSDLALREIASVQVSRDTSAVRAIDDALARLRASPDTFGICTACQSPIPAGRLVIMPTATRCVRCARG